MSSWRMFSQTTTQGWNHKTSIQRLGKLFLHVTSLVKAFTLSCHRFENVLKTMLRTERAENLSFTPKLTL